MKPMAQLFWLKACRRCGGDLYEAPDIETPYVRCLQCTRELSVVEEQYLRVHGSQPAPKVAAAQAA